MARSDTLRGEIARLEAKKAGFASSVAKHQKEAADARGVARKNVDQASRSKNVSTIRSALKRAESADKKAAAADK